LNLTWVLSDVPNLRLVEVTPVTLGMRVVYSRLGINIVRMKSPQMTVTHPQWFLYGIGDGCEVVHLVQLIENHFVERQNFKPALCEDRQLWNNHYLDAFQLVENGRQTYQSTVLKEGKIRKPSYLYPFLNGMWCVSPEEGFLVVQGSILRQFVSNEISEVVYNTRTESEASPGDLVTVTKDKDIDKNLYYVVPLYYFGADHVSMGIGMVPLEDLLMLKLFFFGKVHKGQLNIEILSDWERKKIEGKLKKGKTISEYMSWNVEEMEESEFTEE